MIQDEELARLANIYPQLKDEGYELFNQLLLADILNELKEQNEILKNIESKLYRMSYDEK